jgi:tetratricopeptide (TPR) repeat protein
MCAWLLSTAPEDDLRDGAYAVKLARRACKLTKWRHRSCLRSLAAAYAETGDFERAIEYETKAIALLDDNKADDKTKFLEVYKVSKPYREDRKESKSE